MIEEDRKREREREKERERERERERGAKEGKRKAVIRRKVQVSGIIW